MPDRENDLLTVTLGNKEHSGCTQDIGVKVPGKEGFTRDRAMYKSRKRYEELKKQEAHNQFKEWYTLEKEKE